MATYALASHHEEAEDYHDKRKYPPKFQIPHIDLLIINQGPLVRSLFDSLYLNTANRA